ncbi:MAG: hypothetical protein ACE5D3_08930, partial [Candidatus Binatia bacterium]
MNRSTLISAVLFGALLWSPGQAAAQCVGLPRLVLSDTTCTVGSACQLTVQLQSEGAGVVSATGTLGLPPELTLSTISSGGCAAGNSVFLNSPSFQVIDFTFPFDPFCDGAVVILESQCSLAGTYNVGLTGVSMGDAGGFPVTGACGVAGTITCEDPDPCLTLNCDDGDVCTDDSCDPGIGCVNVNNTASCDDGNACTTSDTCSGGLCVGGAP